MIAPLAAARLSIRASGLLPDGVATPANAIRPSAAAAAANSDDSRRRRSSTVSSASPSRLITAAAALLSTRSPLAPTAVPATPSARATAAAASQNRPPRPIGTGSNGAGRERSADIAGRRGMAADRRTGRDGHGVIAGSSGHLILIGFILVGFRSIPPVRPVYRPMTAIVEHASARSGGPAPGGACIRVGQRLSAGVPDPTSGNGRARSGRIRYRSCDRRHDAARRRSARGRQRCRSRPCRPRHRTADR